ncbi:S9 family peptidase [Novosphingobium sp. LASN5T]|uniref:alpha/beta hydrolase family protein n=1 Tax=Novosphingobium sp. LASN5T TaxID=2491021 RepID=UPI000F5DB2C1|nr:S9 family peptidase [Novosphingobium sp. LASN5T]RQW45684.1 S9 family peptidase [Novosphingobium sp. LASN5T]
MFDRRWLAAAATTIMLAAGVPAHAQADAAPAAQPRPPRIETGVLANQPFLSNPKLSPDGTQIVARMNVAGKDCIGVIKIGENNPRIMDLGNEYDLNWYRWAGNGTILISMGKSVPWDGDDAWQTRLVAFDITTGKTRFIGGREEGLVGDDVLWIDPEGQSILLAYQSTIYDYPSVFTVNLATNRQKQVVQARTDIWDWYADEQGVVRAGFGWSGDRWTMIYRPNATESFHTVVKAKQGDEDAGFDAFRIYQGSDLGYRIMNNEATGRYALYRFNFATRERGELILDNVSNDIDDFDTSIDGANPLAAWYTDDRSRVHWFDKTMHDVQDAIDKAVGGMQASIVSRSRDDSVLMIHLGSSSNAGQYYLYRQDAGKMMLLARVNEKLRSADLVPTRYVHYKARDGLEVPAYLTLPAGRDPKNLPLVILPHGGPYDIRDDGTFDPEVQFLANRGYAVLQPEFRGSGGYGKAFYEKGEGQWGRAMQDDLDDGMDWLAKDGTIDPKRVCLIGASYGGYAALWGATRNPERYRCAASFAGVSDLPRQLKFQIAFKVSKRYRKDWRRTVQGEETFDLRTVSPLFTLDRLRVPVLMMHGTEDQRVPYKQSKLFADALKLSGKPYEFYTLEGEGHGFSTSANMQQWLDRLDVFLAKYNPAD